MTAPDPDRLESWKEIAAYLSRSVRTVRRWEADEGLPVHRHMHHALGSVYAFKSEIDQWRRGAQLNASVPAAATDPGPDQSILVVPFANLGGNPDDEYFADGLTDEVIGDLSNVGALRVISRTSSMALRGTKKDAKTIGREAGVRYLLEGGVRVANGRLRISARLIDAATDSQLWSGKYDGTIEDVLAIQERLARTIVDALRLRLTTDEDRRLAERRGRNPHAYECCLQARHLALRWRPDAIDTAIRLLRNGLALVGDDATLWAALGRTWLQYREAGIDLSERPLREAGECVARVFALDPSSHAAFQLRGWLRYSEAKIQDAVRDLRAALDRAPADPDALALLINCYLISGRVAAARPLVARLLEIDPLTPLTRCLPGWADLLEGRLEAAIAPYARMVEMDPGNPMARLFYVWVLALNGRRDDVRALAATIPARAESTPELVTRFLAAALDGTASAAAILPRGIEAVASGSELFPRFLATGFALAGNEAEALRWLEIAVERGFINYPFLAEHDPILAALRGNPRFEEILETTRARWEAFEA